MPALYPVASNRASEQLLQARLQSQFNFDRLELVRLQDQVSTGIRLTTPSDDAPAATRAITIQRLLEEKRQIITNVNTTSSYVAATGNALTRVSDLLISVRANALSAVDSTNSDSERKVIADEVNRTIEQLVNVGNQKFRGRYLFAGSKTTQSPFDLRGTHVVYEGNEVNLRSLVDASFLLNANVTGAEVFGAISSEVRGTVDLDPILTLDTKLSTLRGGLGITKGSFLISDGTSTKTINIASAETVGDVVRLIESNPPDGRQITVRLTNNALAIDIDDAGAGNLTIREVSGGTTAKQLGIFNSLGGGIQRLFGEDLEPRLQLTTRLTDVLGSRASVVLESTGVDNNIFIEAIENGEEINGVTVNFVSTGVVAGDGAVAVFDEVNRVLKIDVNPGVTRAGTVVNAINATGQFVAQLDGKTDTDNSGTGPIQLAATGTFTGGSGILFDRESGIQIVNGDQTHTITFETAETIEDVLNLLNGSAASVSARIAADGKSIEVRSRLSGSNFAIGENGGTTATEFGIRTLSRGTLLSDLNLGRGVDLTGGNDSLATDPNFVGINGPRVDFTIRRAGATDVDIDISSADTIGDVIDLINTNVNNRGASPISARLAEFGNGILITDENNSGQQSLTIVRRDSFAAWDLGLIERHQETASLVASTSAQATVTFPQPNDQNTGINITANVGGPSFNDVKVIYRDILSGGAASATFAGGTLFVDIDAGQTTANTIIDAINAQGTFTAGLETVQDPANNGSGVIETTGVVASFAGGAFDSVQGADVNPTETKGVFNSLLRLSDALGKFDLVEIGRAVAMLDDDFERLSFSRADLGTRARSINILEQRVQDEDVQLRAALSEEIDADLVKAISDLAARQANMEATLRLIGQTLQLTVLNFI
ncbi:MAG: flagellar hook-associated protein FlgL [Planctomycetota bacterium]|nr:flagellar hook-associated protein FlgL [Planctomycetota bacterium]